MASLSLRSLTRRFIGVDAVHAVSLDIRSGEFFSILGPSGCGKTTLLRMIAGIDSPSEGTILLDGRDITNVAPQERSIGMVFQNYALFPHMTVSQNVAFGLQTRKVPALEAERRVKEVLASVGLETKRSVSVTQLSGGEQQRVAVARALVVKPAVLLFDEPLSNLDVALRLKTREEIRSLQRETGITTIYVTHDQSEAMSLSDRLAVMRSGRIEQVGTPVEVYESPGSPFVAEFLGGATVLRGEVDLPGHRLLVGSVAFPLGSDMVLKHSGPVTVAVKPESVDLTPASPGQEREAVVVAKEYLGFTTNVVIGVGDITFRVSMASSAFSRTLAPGGRVGMRIDWPRCAFFGAQLP